MPLKRTHAVAESVKEHRRQAESLNEILRLFRAPYDVACVETNDGRVVSTNPWRLFDHRKRSKFTVIPRCHATFEELETTMFETLETWWQGESRRHGTTTRRDPSVILTPEQIIACNDSLDRSRMLIKLFNCRAMNVRFVATASGSYIPEKPFRMSYKKLYAFNTVEELNVAVDEGLAEYQIKQSEAHV